MRRLIASLSLLAALPASAYDLVGSGYSQPLFLTAPAGDARLFIVEKGGVIKSQLNGVVSTYLDLSTKVDTGGERGLLGLAFDPNYASNGRFYVDYIDKSSLSTTVAVYTASNPGAGAADASSGKTILTIAQPSDNNHKAGWIGFSSADPGRLYIATGDGGSGNDPRNNAQNLNSNLGKLLRVTPLAGGGYTVPTDNPFVGKPGNDEIFAYGLRNPFRDSFDRQTGDLWIGDVGQGTREEINFATAASGLGKGANYGWRIREGSVATPGINDPNPGGLTEPLYDYGRDRGASVIGGYVYRGGASAVMDGRYIFGDFVSGRIWGLQRGAAVSQVIDLATPFGGNTLSSFGEDGFGGLYAVGLNGQIYRLAASVVPEPTPALLLAAGLAALSLRRRRRV